MNIIDLKSAVIYHKYFNLSKMLFGFETFDLHVEKFVWEKT